MGFSTLHSRSLQLSFQRLALPRCDRPGRDELPFHLLQQRLFFSKHFAPRLLRCRPSSRHVRGQRGTHLKSYLARKDFITYRKNNCTLAANQHNCGQHFGGSNQIFTEAHRLNCCLKTCIDILGTRPSTIPRVRNKSACLFFRFEPYSRSPSLLQQLAGCLPACLPACRWMPRFFFRTSQTRLFIAAPFASACDGYAHT